MYYMRSDLAALRVRKDVNELAKAKFTCSQATTRVEFPDGVENMLRLIFMISIADISGPYANGDFTFFVEIPKTYPFY
ncbi:Ubiquitin-conjugating enzyme E2, partial [Phytophthora megakarya]